MVDSNVPDWLVGRVFGGRNTSSVAQDIALGQQMAEQRQQMDLRAREFALREEALRLKNTGTQFINQGSIELGRLMEEGGQKNLYADPAFEGRLWSLGQRYPQLLDSEVFQGAAKVVENAKLAKEQMNRLTTTQEALNERNLRDNETRVFRDMLKGEIQSFLQGQKDEASMARMRQKLEDALTVVDAKGDWAMELKREQNKLDKERDAARPRSSGNWRYDLPESKRMGMQSAFRSLEAWREIHSGSKYDAEYDQRFEAIEKEYEQFRRKETESPTTTSPVKADPLGLFQ